MAQYKPIKKVTVTEQVMENIADLIVSGELKEGEQLPNERHLAEVYNVSRGRIREALRALSLTGLIEIRPGEGSFVRENHSLIPNDTVTWLFYRERFNIEELYRARKLIELEVYMLAIEKITDVHINFLFTLLKDLKQVQRSNVKGFVDIIDRIDFYLGELTENKIFFKLMQTMIHLRREAYERLVAIDDSWDFAIARRTDLISAFANRDKDELKKVVDGIYLESKRFYGDID